MKSVYFGGIEQKSSVSWKMHISQKMFTKKLNFHEKSAPKKIRKGSEASEGELTI